LKERDFWIMATVLVIADVGLTPAGQAQFPNSGSINAASDGTFSIDSRDLAFALGAGYIPVRRETHAEEPLVTPVAAAAIGTVVASVALTNTTLTVAGNPDTMREVSMRHYAGDCSNIDLLIYVNLQHRHLYPFGPFSGATALASLGWRSVSVIMESLVMVLWAANDAPAFLVERRGEVVIWQGSSSVFPQRL
jgi:hypothetical protein